MHLDSGEFQFPGKHDSSLTYIWRRHPEFRRLVGRTLAGFRPFRAGVLCRPDGKPEEEENGRKCVFCVTSLNVRVESLLEVSWQSLHSWPILRLRFDDNSNENESVKCIQPAVSQKLVSVNITESGKTKRSFRKTICCQHDHEDLFCHHRLLWLRRPCMGYVSWSPVRS